MNYKIGDKILVTTDGWFYAPDGQNYRAVHGTLKGIHQDQELFGIKTNARSTNWYLEIGNMMIAGCQVHYAIKSYHINFDNTHQSEVAHEGRLKLSDAPCRIYNAG